MPHPSLSLAQLERLELVIEECSEVIQASTKILRHGYFNTNPDKPQGDHYFDANNKTQLEKEIGDLLVVLDYLAYTDDVHAGAITRAKVDRSQTVNKWLHHNKIGVHHG